MLTQRDSLLEIHENTDGVRDDVQYTQLNAGETADAGALNPAYLLPDEPPSLKPGQRPYSRVRNVDLCPCPSCCAAFSFSGMVFLLWISTYLAGDSVYLVIEGDHDKPKLANNVYLAAFMYLACFIISVAVIKKRQQCP